MKTLVIHPRDPTTDFLCEIYSGKDWTANRADTSKKILKEQIKSHDRIIMLGHGTEYGLLEYSRMVIDSSWVYLLREKICVCIWCNANIFVDKYGLTGFNTGMIISEYIEAVECGVRCTDEDVLESNKLFSNSIKKSIDSENMLNEVIDIYNGDSGVIEFNRKNLFQS